MVYDMRPGSQYVVRTVAIGMFVGLFAAAQVIDAGCFSCETDRFNAGCFMGRPIAEWLAAGSAACTPHIRAPLFQLDLIRADLCTDGFI